MNTNNFHDDNHIYFIDAHEIHRIEREGSSSAYDSELN